MIEFQTSAILIGFAVGLLMAALFFWGLNWGIRKALGSATPGRLLMLSFFIRLSILLGVGFALIEFNGSLWALVGYMLAFLLVRILTVWRAKSTVLAQQEGA
ncbi:ATP synthase subunit I [Denitrificimonas sp. JX-1]|uniref:ATP synthase subunit I n=1 Tax=Denitrificimonas halotolerans TaxID=3098930 RepID=A0ABU5GPH0_9GAMM|nr:ATP synthase subunit I [Denitrificimonas sp. JX-1]MDY7218620.1 ATP synthase subunit I [Denitrificimonas sp. JX-1]